MTINFREYKHYVHSLILILYLVLLSASWRAGRLPHGQTGHPVDHGRGVCLPWSFRQQLPRQSTPLPRTLPVLYDANGWVWRAREHPSFRVVVQVMAESKRWERERERNSEREAFTTSAFVSFLPYQTWYCQHLSRSWCSCVSDDPWLLPAQGRHSPHPVSHHLHPACWSTRLFWSQKVISLLTNQIPSGMYTYMYMYMYMHMCVHVFVVVRTLLHVHVHVVVSHTWFCLLEL